MAAPFTPPKKPPYLKYVKIPDEALEVLGTYTSRAQYDKLCGAIVRYMMTGEVEQVTKGIGREYVMLKGGMDRIRQGAINRYKGNDGQEADEFSPENGPMPDENQIVFEQELNENWNENQYEYEQDSYYGFQQTTDNVPAETQDMLGNQTNEHLGNQTNEHLGNQRYEYESEYGIECESDRGVIGGNVPDETTNLKLSIITNKLVALKDCTTESAEDFVQAAYKRGGLSEVERLCKQIYGLDV